MSLDIEDCLGRGDGICGEDGIVVLLLRGRKMCILLWIFRWLLWRNDLAPPNSMSTSFSFVFLPLLFFLCSFLL
jgi:hypothetical protein